MERLTLAPAAERLERARRMGFAYAAGAAAPWWEDGAFYRFSAAEIAALRRAAAEIERICRLAVDHAVRHGLHAPLGIPAGAWPIAVRSWEGGEPGLLCRLDLRWDGSGPPRLLDVGADSPTGLREAALLQWEWLQCLGAADAEPGQFNDIETALAEAWPALGLPPRLHLCAQPGSLPDRGMMAWLRDSAARAGFDATLLGMAEIGWDGRDFLDAAGAPILAMVKLYPWDWLLREAFGAHVAAARTRWIEPAWRLIPASKAFLALLWHLFPDHPNLLPAHLEPGRCGGPEIGKPFWGRGGANIVAPGLVTEGPYGGQPRVWQEFAELPAFAGRHAALACWLVGGRPAGLGIREDAGAVIGPRHRFVPHLLA